MNNSDSDNESIEGEVKVVSTADWGKTKRDYYYTDYIDKDYPSKLTAKEEKLASLEQEEAIRIQKKFLSTLDNVVDLQATYDDNDLEENTENLIDIIEKQNQSLNCCKESNPRKKVKFDVQESSTEEEEDDKEEKEQGRIRRPIDIAIKKNRGLTPYKKKEYRNPRVKHKLKYKKALSKRRRIITEAKPEYHRYEGESTGIKTSTIKSTRLSS